jgi:starch synthase (maltosyl-transferring)
MERRIAERARVLPREGPERVAIEDVTPQVDGGAFPAKRVVGDAVDVEADIFTDGTSTIVSVLRWRPAESRKWDESPMAPIGNDRWRGTFRVDEMGRYRFSIRAWVDPFLSWRELLGKRIEGKVVERRDLEEGLVLLKAVAARAKGADRSQLEERIEESQDRLSGPLDEAARYLYDPSFLPSIRALPPSAGVTTLEKELEVQVDPLRAGHSAWYEIFPRSTSRDPKRPGTFETLIDRLPYIARLGFDVVYLPPIHPIGRTRRRGPNNRLEAGAEAPGSPWAIGGAEGGHTAIEPGLGTLYDFDRLLVSARGLGLEVALDLAFQVAPDHPWVTEHPDWFHHLPDGSIRTAENPPKKYDDIYPIDFGSADWRSLWQALLDVVLFWVDRGIRWFRVDNPHTKPFGFWQWLIEEVRREHPDVLFLAEAFTRPRVMYRLAKIGFTHSYTYFTWRPTKNEIVTYFRELGEPPVSDLFRPHLWPNTPDILPGQLQTGGRPAFLAWFVLAATLSSNYGIYGPVFELAENRPTGPGHEEYLDSEKYEVRHWDLDAVQSLAPFIRRVNRIRKENAALLQVQGLTFHGVSNPSLVAYSRATRDRSNVVLMFVNLDPRNPQSGMTDLDLEALGIPPGERFQVDDLLSERRFLWHGPSNYVELRPHEMPAHIFLIRRLVHRADGTEAFD